MLQKSNVGCFVKKLKAFSLAEVALALLIVGLISAITLPSLQINIDSTIQKVKKKALLNRTTQAMIMMDNIKRYQTGEAFVDKYRDVVKLNIVCSQDTFWGCGLPQTFMGLDGNMYPMPRSWSQLNPLLVDVYYEDIDSDEIFDYTQDDLDSVSFITDNGESINLFYNPNCLSYDPRENPSYFVAQAVCVNMIFDLNGVKAPNMVGKDIGFISVFNASEPAVVMVNPHISDVETKTQVAASGSACREVKPSLRAPTDFELASMFINTKYIGLHEGLYWTSSLYSASNAWYLWGTTGLMRREPMTRGEEMDVRCIER